MKTNPDICQTTKHFFVDGVCAQCGTPSIKKLKELSQDFPMKPKPAPKGDTTQKRRQDKRKADMQAAAILNGFANWSSMMTFIKNQALEGRRVVMAQIKVESRQI